MNIKKIGLILLLVLIFGITTVAIVYATSETESESTSETSETKTSSVDLEIGSNYFVTNMNDIYLNYGDYVGKTVSYKGFAYNSDGTLAIVRYYYCCGYDYSIVGLECDYDKESLTDGEWAQVTGTIQLRTDSSGDVYPYLKVTSLKKVEGSDSEIYVNN